MSVGYSCLEGHPRASAGLYIGLARPPPYPYAHPQTSKYIGGSIAPSITTTHQTTNQGKDTTMTQHSTRSPEFTAPPCPAWCEEPTDHDRGNPTMHEHDGSYTRIHDGGKFELIASTDHSLVKITIGQIENISRTGESRCDQPGIDLQADTCILTAHEARYVAAHLNLLADQLDHIQGDQS